MYNLCALYAIILINGRGMLLQIIFNVFIFITYLIKYRWYIAFVCLFFFLKSLVSRFFEIFNLIVGFLHLQLHCKQLYSFFKIKEIFSFILLQRLIFLQTNSLFFTSLLFIIFKKTTWKEVLCKENCWKIYKSWNQSFSIFINLFSILINFEDIKFLCILL